MANGGTSEPDDEPDESGDDLEGFRPLSRAERVASSLIGTLGLVAGGTAVFVSDNQAGTTTLLLAGALFLLIGVQGSPIKRATKESVDFVGNRVAKNVKRSLIEDGPEAAKAKLESYELNVRGVEESAAVARVQVEIADAITYEFWAVHACQRLIGDELGYSIVRGRGPRAWDLVVQDQENVPVLYIEFRYYRNDRAFPRILARQFELKASERPAEGLFWSEPPALLVTNGRTDHLDSGTQFRFTTWRNPQDDANLRAVILPLLNPRSES